ncbi:hypothetical protein JCM13304A_24670 [Desulfothermus okinawensis JCM 13304]
MKPMGTFKNNTKASILSKEIMYFHNRGFASAKKIQTVLNLIRNNTEIKHLKNLNKDIVKEIAEEIAEKVEDGEINATSGADYISALNQIIDYTNHFFNQEIKEIHYSEYFCKSTKYEDKSVSQEIHQNFQEFLSEKYKETGEDRYKALQLATKLQRELGLRFRESVGLNKKTIERSLETGKLSLSRQDWTKNAREREIQLNEDQKKLLEETKNYLEKSNQVNLAGAQAENWKDYKYISHFRSFADSVRTEFNSSTNTNYRFHGERHAFAQSRYAQLWEQKIDIKIDPPIKCKGDFWTYVKDQVDCYLDKAEKHIEDKLTLPELKAIDKEIRQEISQELGHNRVSITHTYLGCP